jgi:superfamily II DNA or RNA helicase
MNSQERKKLKVLLFLILSKLKNQNKNELLKILNEANYSGYSPSDINSVLYGSRDLFSRSEDKLPLWSAYELEIEEETISDLRDLKYYRGHPPRTWQIEALEEWIKAGRRGVVEAVTGTGKTTLGILAAADAIARGFKVLIIVPGIDLLDQWYKNLVKSLTELEIAKLGGGFKNTLEECDVLVSTVQSARKFLMLPEGSRGLIIADEVHGYGSEISIRALEPEFEDRLGLTATYDRNDNGLDELLSPYFTPEGNIVEPGKEVIVGCGYSRGLADGILAPFRVALLGIELEDMEQDIYDSLTDRVIKLKKKLVEIHDCPAKPFGEFIACVRKLSNGDVSNSIGTILARQYLDSFTKRRALLASSLRKLEALNYLIPVINSANKTLIFTQTIKSASMTSELLIREGILALEFSSNLKKDQRKEIMQHFRDGSIRVLAAPKVLDEGIDVPDVDLGIILSASHSKRQMIQRMGRIIRPKMDSRPATFIILYAMNTNEDPEYGIHEAFLSEMYDHAESIFNKGVDWTVEELLGWLAGFNEDSQVLPAG